MSKISDAIANVARVEKENAQRLADANSLVIEAVADDFVSGAKVKTKDKITGGKDGKPVKSVPGSTYTVITVVEGGDVLLKGKGASKKVIHYTKLELV